MTTIVTEFGIFIYNCLLKGMCNLNDELNAKVNEITDDIKGIKNT